MVDCNQFRMKALENAKAWQRDNRGEKDEAEFLDTKVVLATKLEKTAVILVPDIYCLELMGSSHEIRSAWKLHG